MKTMQTAGRGKASDWQEHLARTNMKQEYAEARFDLTALRISRAHRTDDMHRTYFARMKVQHDLARAALRNLNALKAEVTP